MQQCNTSLPTSLQQPQEGQTGSPGRCCASDKKPHVATRVQLYASAHGCGTGMWLPPCSHWCIHWLVTCRPAHATKRAGARPLAGSAHAQTLTRDHPRVPAVQGAGDLAGRRERVGWDPARNWSRCQTQLKSQACGVQRTADAACYVSGWWPQPWPLGSGAAPRSRPGRLSYVRPLPPSRTCAATSRPSSTLRV